MLVSEDTPLYSRLAAAYVRGKLGLPVERDQTFVADKPLSAYAEEARAAGRITA